MHWLMSIRAKHIIISTTTKKIHLHKMHFVPGLAKGHRMLPQWRSHWRPSPGSFSSSRFWISILTSYRPLQSYFFLGRLQALCFSRTGKHQARRSYAYPSDTASADASPSYVLIMTHKGFV